MTKESIAGVESLSTCGDASDGAVKDSDAAASSAPTSIASNAVSWSLNNKNMKNTCTTPHNNLRQIVV